MNCTTVCPKGLNPAKAIGHIRSELLQEEVWSFLAEHWVSDDFCYLDKYNKLYSHGVYKFT